MIKLFEAADLYLSRCKWQDMALLKICLLALGITIGMGISGKKRKKCRVAAPIVFGITCVPLMLKFMEAFKDIKPE